MKNPYRVLWYRLTNWFRQSLAILWLVGVAGYLLVMVGQAFYRNYQSHQETLAMKQELEEAERERERLEALLIYYKTDAYKEKELRRALLLKRPEEAVYALPESSISKSLEEVTSAAVVKEAKKQPEEAIWKQWVHYLLNQGAENS